MNEMYFQYLYSLVGKNTKPYGCFWRLMRLLYSREFRFSVKNDDNRAKDGCLLRHDFAFEFGYSEERVAEELNGPCRVLEMLVALAARINEELMWDPDKGDLTYYWFWCMIHNIGLDQPMFRDEYFNGDSMLECHKILDKWLDRRFEKNGFGGLFPLTNPVQDQRKVEFWYQLNAWLNENYPFEIDKNG